MPLIFWAGVVLVAGLISTVQFSSNSSVAQYVGATGATIINTVTFLVAIIVYGLYQAHAGLLDMSRVREIPWHHMIGGLCGFAVVLMIAMSYSKVGALWTTALLILGQSVMAIVVDHFGLFQVPQVSVSPQRLLAVGLMLAGTYLLKH